MKVRTVIAYKNYFIDFVKSLPEKLQDKITKTILYVETLQMIPEKYLKHIEGAKGLYEITLDQAVEAGTYENSTLKYECYRMDEQLTPLNGSEIRLTLEVK